MHNLHGGGEFTKYLNVRTNAKNKADFRLSLSGSFKPLIELEPTGSVRLSATTDTGEVVTVKTAIKDLKFIDITFRESGKEQDWKSIIPITYMLVLSDVVKQKTEPEKTKKQGAKTKPTGSEASGETYIYKLRLKYVPESKSDIYGDFIIKTNVPEKPEIKLSGILEKKN